MTSLVRAFLTLTALGSLLAPIGSRAGGVDEDCAVFQTPVSAMGRFVYVTRVSRRELRRLVADTQQPYRPVVAKGLL